MMRHFRIGVVVLTAAFMASGCVSSGTFKKMEAGKNQEIAALQQEKASLEQKKSSLDHQNAELKQQVSSQDQQKAMLEQQKAVLEKQKAVLEKQMAELEREKAAAQQQVGSLEQQKAALLANSRQRQQQYEELMQGLAKEVEKGQLQVRQYQNMLAVDLAEQIFFDSGRAMLKAGGKEVLQKVAGALKGYENKIIRVVGHTDNVPVAKSLQGLFPSNWELSVARAINVVRFLQVSGIPPERMVPSGRGEYEPVAPNDTPEGRQKNRRIEIVLIDKNLVSEMSRTSN